MTQESWPPRLARYGVRLEPIAEADLEMVRLWRNSPEINQYMLEQRHISTKQQLTWFQGLQGDKRRAYWVAYFKGEPIGVASLLAIDYEKGLAEPSLYIYPEQYRSNIVPFCVAFALNDMAFFEIGLKRLDAIVLSHNSAALRFNIKCGYQQLSELTPGQIAMSLDPQDYIAARDPLARFIRY